MYALITSFYITIVYLSRTCISDKAESFGRLLPAREVVDQLGHCRRHNFDHRDEALLGQVRLARGCLDSKWLEVAAREARAINMWDHEWIRHHIFNPDSRQQSRRSSRQRGQKIRLGLLRVCLFV